MQNPEKISLKIHHNQDIRRLTINKSTYAELYKLIISLFRFPTDRTVSVQYKDDEDDLCTISSDDELREALRLAGNGPLRLQIDSQPVKQSPNRSCAEWPGRGKCMGKWARMGQRIQNSNNLSNKALDTMDHDVSAAKALFLEQLDNCPPWHLPICLYNLACCDSILKNPECALVYLSRAIDAGFRDAAHMQTDPDLENIKNTQEFKELHTSLTSQPEKTTGPEQLYNLGCYHSLMGNTEAAIQSLGKAIETGFFRINRMLNNPDLNLLHALPKWSEFVEQTRQNREKRFDARRNCRQQVPVPAAIPVQVEEPVVAVVVEEPVVAVEPSQPIVIGEVGLHHSAFVPPTLLDVLSEMGFVDRNRNIDALLACGLDIEKAIIRLLKN